jgi:hypothetical protein
LIERLLDAGLRVVAVRGARRAPANRRGRSLTGMGSLWAAEVAHCGRRQ